MGKKIEGIFSPFYLSFFSVLLGIIAQTILLLAREPPQTTSLAWVSGPLGPQIAVALYVVAAILAILVSQATAHRQDEISPLEEHKGSLKVWDLVLSLLSIAASSIAVVVFPGRSSHLLIWILGTGALIGILGSIYRLRGCHWGAADQPRRFPQVELVAIIALLLLATAWRANLLDLVPSGIFFDEAQNGLDAVEILERNTHPVWSDSLSGRPTLHLHLLAGVFKLIGIHVFSMKLVSISFGLFTVAALYLLARCLFGWQVAILAAAFLALSRFHLHYSRIVFEAIMASFFFVMAFYFLWRALRHGRWREYVLSGFFLGLGLYTYVSFRLLPLFFVPFLLHRLLFERGFLRRNLPGLLLFAAVVALLLFPLARFAFNNPARFLTRFNEVSLINEIRRVGSWQPALKNAVGYLTMFNFRGDQNRIQNLPGEPALSFLASIFFVFGLAVSLYRWRDARYASLFFWFLVALLPGVLTHSLETPHSTRVIVAIPVACLFAGIALHDLGRALAGPSSRPSLQTASPHRIGQAHLSLAVVLLFLVATGLLDYRAYFVQQAANPNCYYGFEPAANRIGRLVEQWQQDYHIFVSPNFYYVFPEDAVVRFVAYNAREYQPLDYLRDIPYKGEADKGVAYILEPHFLPVISLLQRSYPKGVLQEHFSPFQGLLFATYRVAREDILATRGLDGHYYHGVDGGDKPSAGQRDFLSGCTWQQGDAPISPPLAVRWQGSLYVPAYGAYVFDVQATGDAELYLNDSLIKWGQEMVLPKGLHAITINYVQEKAEGALRIYWKGPGFSRQIIPAHALASFLTPPHGLEATYYRRREWEGAPASIQLDPLIFTNNFLLEGMFSIVWRGQIYIPQSGSYRFGTDSDDASFLYLDDKLIVDNGGVHGARYREGAATLTQGWHDILIKYSQDGGGMDLVVFWTLPSGQRERLPESQLRYPIGDWGKEIVVSRPVPPPQMPAEPKPLSPLSLGPLVVKWGKEGSGKGEFRQPRGIAMDAQGRVYVADSGNKRVQVFDSNGHYLAAWEKGDMPFEVPWDIVIVRDEVFVLDAGPCWIYRFDMSGHYLGKFGGPDARLYQPRGLSADGAGNLYVADTGGHRIVKFDITGRLVAPYGSEGSGPGQLLEPTDIAFSSTGEMFIVDNSNHRVQRWDAGTSYLGEWLIPIASAYNGPHIALAADDSLFITVPEIHEIWRYSPTGAVLGKWGGPGQFRVPTDLALEGDRFLYVADTLQHQVHKFQLLQSP